MTPYERGFLDCLERAAKVCREYAEQTAVGALSAAATICVHRILSLTPEAPASQPEGMKPCPFCGSDQVGIGYTGQPAVGWVVVCLQCKARGPLSEINDDATPAIKGWGTRAEQLEGVVVPREPTRSMLVAGVKSWEGPAAYKVISNDGLKTAEDDVRLMYSAMLAAANEERDAQG